MTKDMTNGSPMKLILGFSIPLLFGYLFQQFYNLVDTLIVGRFLGVDALAAVGSTGSLNFLIIGFCMGVCNGFAIPLAHKFGAGDYKGLRAFMVNAVYLSAVFAVVMTIVTVVFCRPILELMRTPDNIIDGAYLYIVIIFAGIPATYLYNLISAIIRSMGDSKTPVVFLVISSVMNIVLDLVFIINLHHNPPHLLISLIIKSEHNGDNLQHAKGNSRSYEQPQERCVLCYSIANHTSGHHGKQEIGHNLHRLCPAPQCNVLVSLIPLCNPVLSGRFLGTASHNTAYAKRKEKNQQSSSLPIKSLKPRLNIDAHTNDSQQNLSHPENPSLFVIYFHNSSSFLFSCHSSSYC